MIQIKISITYFIELGNIPKLIWKYKRQNSAIITVQKLRQLCLDITLEKLLTSKESSFNRIRAMFCDTNRQEYPEMEKGQRVNFHLSVNY